MVGPVILSDPYSPFIDSVSVPLEKVLADRFEKDIVSPAVSELIITSEVPVTTSARSIVSPLS